MRHLTIDIETFINNWGISRKAETCSEKLNDTLVSAENPKKMLLMLIFMKLKKIHNRGNK